MKCLFFAFCFFSARSVWAQFELGSKAISSMQGCYHVSFKFQESESHHPDYKKKEGVYAEEAREFIALSQNEKSLSLQHVLMAGPHLIKHWTQEWEYSPSYLFSYEGHNTWQKKILKPSKNWVQRVFSVDDSPRYQGLGVWVHRGGESFWESKAFAPLPRREYSQRNDYQILLRRNVHHVFKDSWTHSQKNTKIVQPDRGKQYPLASELGLNTYKTIPMGKCLRAKK